MLERLLVPLDGSGLSELAVPYAEEFAARLGSEVTLLHVGESAEAYYRRTCKDYLSGVIESMNRALGVSEEAANQIRLQSVVLAGNPAGRIVQYARNNSIDLIVMSTHGRTGIKPWALGSVADKVARAAPVPVLLVRGQERSHGIQKRPNLAKAVVPLDGSEESESSIPWVTEIARKLSMQVSLLQVIEVGYRIAPSGYGWVVMPQDQLQSDETKAKEYLESMRSRLMNDGVTVERVLVKQGDPAEEIAGFAAATGADMIAMSTHGRSGIGRWALGGVASKVLNGSSVPILLVRAKKR